MAPKFTNDSIILSVPMEKPEIIMINKDYVIICIVN